MNTSRGRFCQLYRPIGALLLALIVLILLLRACGAPAAPAAPTPTASAPVVAPTSAPTAAPTLAPTSAPPTPAAPTAQPPTAPAPTALPISVPKLNAPAASDFTADGVNLSGVGQPGATVEVWDGATRLGAATVGADGTWRLAAKLGAGAHTLTARTVDAAGKALNESAPLEVTAPAPPTPTAPPALTATAAPTATAAAGEGEGEAYTVVSGDWLIRLSEKYYGNANEYMRIVEATNAKAATDPTYRRIANPNLIAPGQKLWIPPKP